MVAALVLGTSGVIRGGSSPLLCTEYIRINIVGMVPKKEQNNLTNQGYFALKHNHIFVKIALAIL